MLPLCKIGIIGNGNHSKRIQKILKKKKLRYFIYKPKKPNYFEKQDYNNLLKCDAIFIISPNDSHFGILMNFQKKYLYIL